MALTVKDLDRVQRQVGNAYDIELVDGAIVLMSPSGYESDEVASEFSAQLRNWVRPRELGRITGAGAGFTTSETDTIAPDVSFVRAERLRRSPRRFAQLAPDLMVEVKSPTDTLKALRSKIDKFLDCGTVVGILIHPEQRWLEVRRKGEVAVQLKDGEVLVLPDLLPGWELQISELWPLVFDV
jgi:Uma2 family endonuclease